MKIQLKHSETLDNGQAVAPQAQYMLDGEVAVNMASADPRLFLKLSDDTIGNLPVIPATGGSYLRADSADEKTSGYLRFNDNIELQIGSGDDLTIKSDGTHSYFDATVGADIFLTENNVNKFTFDMGAASFTSQGSITSNTSIAAATGMAVNSNTVWHAGNDGSGSGLDADTLDGISSSSFLRSDQDATKTSGYLRFNDNIELQIGTGDDLTIKSTGTHTYFDVPSGSDIFFTEANTNKFTFDMGAASFTSQGSITSYTSIAASTGMTVNSNTVWHAGNDGSGSGLDADTLDGISSESFLRSNQADIKTNGYLRFNDNIELQIGTGDDLTIRSNGSHTYFDVPSTSDIYFMEADVLRFQFDMGNGDFTAIGDIVANESMAVGTTVDSAHKLNVNGSINSVPICCSIHGGGTNILGTSFETITLDYNLYNSDQINHFLLSGTNGTQVKIPGLYRITFTIAFDATSGGTTSHNIAEAKLRVGFSDIDSSLVYIATNGSAYGENSVSNTVIMDLSANTYVELRARRATTNTSMICREHATTMTFERIGSS